MARPSRDTIQAGVAGWDSTVNDNFIRLFDNPLAIHEHTGDESDLASTFPAASYDNCLVWVDHTVDGWVLYHSDGSTWDNFFDRFAPGSTFTSLSDTPSSYTSQGGKVLAVNSGGTAVEFVDTSQALVVAASDESTAIAATGTKLTFRMPYAFTLTAVRASLTGACTTGTLTVDINEGGTTILSTKLTIDATETTSEDATVPAVISDSALADDAEITIDVDNTGDGTATGLKVALIGRKT